MTRPALSSVPPGRGDAFLFSLFNQNQSACRFGAAKHALASWVSAAQPVGPGFNGTGVAMSKRYRERNLPGRLIEVLEQRRLLSTTVHLAAVLPQAVKRVATTGAIYGQVINDINHNFSEDRIGWAMDPDPVMPGVMIYLDANGNGRFDDAQSGANGPEPAERHVSTDSSGKFLFPHLRPGTYRVREVAPEGLQLYSAAFVKVVVAAGDKIDVGTFQNTDYVVIDGTKHSDVILVESDPAGLRVVLNGRAPVLVVTEVHGVLVRSGYGDDSVTIGAGILAPTTLDGGVGADTLTAGNAATHLIGGAGDDVINGSAGKDTIEAGAGNDLITGGAGDDHTDGGMGNNTIIGDAGDDWITSGGENDLLSGGDGNDTILGNDGTDNVDGGAGDDFIYVGANGLQTINGGEGDDLINTININASYPLSGVTALVRGGPGDDSFDLEALGITLDGGAGVDSVTSMWGVPVDVRHVEHKNTKVPNYGSYGGGGGGICFLTTAVVAWAGKANDGPELTLLRRFRDTYMRRLPEGPDIIRDYYTHAPRIVRAIENNGLAALEWPCVLAMVQTAIRHIRARRNSKALAVYAAEYLRLKARYAQV